MHIGLALPQYDYAQPGPDPLSWATIADYATLAETVGIDSIWLSDHLFLDVGKYGGPPVREGAFEPVVSLAALARITESIRLGALVLCEALRPASLTAKALASLQGISGGRLDVGVGAGWYEPDYEAIGMQMPSPGERMSRLSEALQVVRGALAGEELTFDGEYHQARGAIVDPPADPVPRVFAGGKGDRLLSIVSEHADGWNTCWVWTPEGYRQRLDVLERACERVGRDPATVWRTLGLYALVGESRADLERRFERMRERMPPGTLDTSLDEWRPGRLVGTVDEVRAQARAWRDLGVETLILGLGSVPFAVSAPDDVELAVAALTGIDEAAS